MLVGGEIGHCSPMSKGRIAVGSAPGAAPARARDHAAGRVWRLHYSAGWGPARDDVAWGVGLQCEGGRSLGVSGWPIRGRGRG